METFGVIPSFVFVKNAPVCSSFNVSMSFLCALCVYQRIYIAFFSILTVVLFIALGNNILLRLITCPALADEKKTNEWNNKTAIKSNKIESYWNCASIQCSVFLLRIVQIQSDIFASFYYQHYYFDASFFFGFSCNNISYKD